MKRIAVLLAAIAIVATVCAQSDPLVASVQQKLKDDGFYYGEVTGKKDADTTAAIRRYQIRNGLDVTGELNAETQKSLGVKGAVTTPPPPPSATPAPVIRQTPPPDNSDLLDDSTVAPSPAAPQRPFDADVQPPTAYAPGPRGLAPATSGIFDGTPYEVAPPDVQRRVVLGAQTLLASRGYYRDPVDGEFGPATEFAVRAFQSRFNIPPTGRLDMDTLAALGLLPGQRAPGVTAPRRGGNRRPPQAFTPEGEPIYEPRSY